MRRDKTLARVRTVLIISWPSACTQEPGQIYKLPVRRTAPSGSAVFGNYPTASRSVNPQSRPDWGVLASRAHRYESPLGRPLRLSATAGAPWLVVIESVSTCGSYLLNVDGVRPSMNDFSSPCFKRPGWHPVRGDEGQSCADSDDLFGGGPQARRHQP